MPPLEGLEISVFSFNTSVKLAIQNLKGSVMVIPRGVHVAMLTEYDLT